MGRLDLQNLWSHHRCCPSGPSAAPCAAPCADRRRWLPGLFGGGPRLPSPLFNVKANKAPHDLGGCRVLLGAQVLEESLLARVEEDRQSCGAVFESHGHPEQATQYGDCNYNRMRIKIVA